MSTLVEWTDARDIQPEEKRSEDECKERQEREGENFGNRGRAKKSYERDVPEKTTIQETLNCRLVQN